jgi:hypothetical protein
MFALKGIRRIHWFRIPTSTTLHATYSNSDSMIYWLRCSYSQHATLTGMIQWDTSLETTVAVLSDISYPVACDPALQKSTVPLSHAVCTATYSPTFRGRFPTWRVASSFVRLHRLKNKTESRKCNGCFVCSFTTLAKIHIYSFEWNGKLIMNGKR